MKLRIKYHYWPNSCIFHIAHIGLLWWIIDVGHYDLVIAINGGDRYGRFQAKDR